MIDTHFYHFAKDKLTPLAQYISGDLGDAAWEMTKDKFQDQKMEFGDEDSDLQNQKTIDVPGLPRDFTMESAGVRRGKLRYTK
jgi:hypothetical protein